MTAVWLWATSDPHAPFAGLLLMFLCALLVANERVRDVVNGVRRDQ